jgi:hypothetical protein
MVVILDERYMLFATSKPSSPMGFYGWENWLRLQRKISPLSMFVFRRVMCRISNHIYRERREHRVFQELLKSVAGLEERLMQGGDEEVDVVAELASTISFSYVFKVNVYLISSPRAPLEQGVTTPKASKAACLTGLLQRDRIWFLLLPET